MFARELLGLTALALALVTTSVASWAQSTTKELSADGPKFEFRMVGQTSPQLKQYVLVEKVYFGDQGIVEKLSNGRIKFKLAAGSEMGLRDADHGNVLALGTIDFAQVAFQQSLALKLPLALAADLPGLYPDLTTAQRAIEALTPRLSKFTEEQQGLKLLGNFSFSGDVMFCNTPVKSIDDLKGKRIRTFGAALSDVLDGLGATNVVLAFGEVYSALQQGVIDCAVTDAASGNSQKWWEVSTHLYALPVSLGPGTYAVNLKLWNSLPPDVQTFMQDIFAEVTKKQWDLARELAQVANDCNIGKSTNCPAELGSVATRPMTLVEPSKDDIDKLKKVLVSVVIPTWVKQCGTAVVTEDECRRIFNETVGPAVGISLQ